LAFHQQAADELGGDQVGGAGEEGLRECWEGVVAMGYVLKALWTTADLIGIFNGQV